MKNRLPQYWIVKNDGSQLFKDTVLKDLDEINNSSRIPWAGKYNYYGYDGKGVLSGTNGYNRIEEFKNNPTLLTLAEYVELRKPIEEVIDSFVLPEYWYVKATRENEEILTEWRQGNHTGWREDLIMLCDPRWAGLTFSNLSDYTEITFKQFKKYVLKEKTMERELIGYKLKPEFDKEQFQKAYCSIVEVGTYGLYSKGESFKTDTHAYNKLKEAGVLDIWFEPVYKEIPEFKIGDIVVVVKDSIGGDNKKGNNSSRRANHIFKISNKIKSGHTHIKEWLYDIEESSCGISVNLVRHATEEEIAKWKEENEFKLPVINGYTGYYHEGLLVWGNNCAIFEPAFFLALKPFVYAISFDKTNRSLQAIRLSSGVEITIAQLEQIINFIEHNIK